MTNYCMLIGRIANDFEVKVTENNKSVSQITLAVSKPFKNPSTSNFDVDFIKISLWEHVAINTHEYCKKGDLIAVKGRIGTKKEQREDYSVNLIEIIGERVLFLSTPKLIEKEIGSNNSQTEDEEIKKPRVKKPKNDDTKDENN